MAQAKAEPQDERVTGGAVCACGVLMAEQVQGEMQCERREAMCSQRCSATTEGCS